MAKNENGAPNNFETQILDYIRKSNAGHQKAGFGPFSIKGNQAGNADLAKALLDFRRSDANDSFKDLNKVGKGILDSIQKMAEEGISSDSVDNRNSAEQIKVMKELLTLVEDGTDEQKKSKKELIDFIGKTEKGLLKNASFKNRLVEISRAVLPSAAGIMAGMFSKSPVIAGLVNFGMEKLQDRYARKQKSKIDNVQKLIGIFDEIAAEEQRKSKRDDSSDDSPSRRSTDFGENNPMPVKIVDQRTPIEIEKPKSASSEEEATLEDFYLGVRDALEESQIDEDLILEVIKQTKEAIEEMTGNDPEKIKEFMALAVEATSTESEILERIASGVIKGEESAREDRFQMQRQNQILERVADATEGLADKDEGAGKKGILSGLMGGEGGIKDKILQWLGIGAIGTTAMSKLGAVFGMLKSVSSKVLAIGGRFLPASGKILSKIFSFPVQFFIAVGNGLKRGISSLLKGEGLGAAAKETLFGFANWFLAGFLDKVNDWFSNHRILDPIFRSIEGAVTEVKDFFVGIYDTAKSNFDAVRDFVSSPIDGIKKMSQGVEDYWISVIQTMQRFIKDPKEFISARVEQIREGIKRFFYSMVPSWIPLKFIPEAIRDDVKKARYGSPGGSLGDAETNSKNKANFTDNIFNEFFTEETSPLGGSTGSRSRGGSRGNSGSDPSPDISGRANDGLAQRERQRVPVAQKSTATSDDMIGRLLKREGGFVNDPDDKGGATNMGITQNTLSEYLGKQASVEDVRNLDEATARKIYEKEYLSPFGDVQDNNLKEFLLDFGAHSGTERVKGFYETAKAGGGSEQDILEKLIERRRTLFKNIIKNDPTQKKFEKGWNNRLSEFESKAKESRAASMYSANKQAEKPVTSVAPVVATSKSTVNNVNNTTVSRRTPINQDPTQRFYSPSLATA